jgi:hypothetical protein
VRHAARNRFGQATALTVITPVMAGHLAPLAASLDTLGGGEASPLARVAGTHFARWVIMDDVVFEGGRQKRDRLAAPRLLFTSNFDGGLAPYLEALRAGTGEAADAIWGHCAGYPGREDGAAWAAWFGAHQLDCSLFFAAYGTQTVDQVRADLAARDALRSFALAHRGTPPAELRARFAEVFSR